MPPEVAELEHVVRHLAAVERASASRGEHEAAEWIAGRFRELGLEPEIEEERGHGTYWIPTGLLAAIGALGGLVALRGRRAAGVLAGAFGAAGIWNDVDGGSKWFRRAFLPHRAVWNVTAEAGDPAADRTVVFLAHHDAARASLLFNPAVPAAVARRFPRLLERAETSPQLYFLVFGGPAAVAIGSLLGRRGLTAAGTIVSLGTAAVMAEMGARETVPGANDNLTGVATLVGLARALRERPVENVRVLLVSCGAEESFQEGITAWGKRWFPRLSPDTTRFVCVDTVGSPELTAPEAEGMLVMRKYDHELKQLLSECAESEGIGLGRGLRFGFSSDAVTPLRAGFRTAMLGSVNEFKTPSNYHWPTDHADNVVYERVGDAVRLCESLLRRLAKG